MNTKKATAVLTGYKLDRASRFSHCELSGNLKQFLSSIIRQRIRLVESGNSRKNEMLMRRLIEKYKPYRSYQFTNRGGNLYSSPPRRNKAADN